VPAFLVDVRQGNVHILHDLQSDRRSGASSKLFLNRPIRFYLHNVKNLRRLTSQSATSCPTTWRSYRNHRLLGRHFTLSILRYQTANRAIGLFGCVSVCVCMCVKPTIKPLFPRKKLFNGIFPKTSSGKVASKPLVTVHCAVADDEIYNYCVLDVSPESRTQPRRHILVFSRPIWL